MVREIHYTSRWDMPIAEWYRRIFGDMTLQEWAGDCQRSKEELREIWKANCVIQERISAHERSLYGLDVYNAYLDVCLDKALRIAEEREKFVHEQ